MLASMEPGAAPVASDGAWLLLAELNRRVRNELQVALSALRRARRGLASGEPERFIEEALLRLEAFGCVQHLLDRQRGQGSLAQRLEALCRATSRAKAAPLGIHLTLKLEEVTTDEETAWTVCVVAPELMTNAFKHAFAGVLPGVVSVVLRQEGEEVLLKVTDNGVWAAAQGRSAQTVWQAPGLGSGIVAQLAERLDGFTTRASGPKGTTATFRVPAARRLQ
jgi:two-component sensor histidine kinase